MILKFIKFSIVGFSGMFVDFGITYLAKEIIKINKYLANSIGFMFAASSNYILNRIWTFESHNPDISFEYMSFIVISLVGLLINNTALFLIEKRFKLNFYLAKLFAIGITTIWNFAANNYITFSLLEKLQ